MNRAGDWDCDAEDLAAAAESELDQSAPVSTLQLGVRGYACHVFGDARVAWSLHRETHMIPWRMESDLRVDRFDARNLLDDRALFRQRKRSRVVSSSNSSSSSESSSMSTAVSDVERELHALRYGDYAVEFPPPVEHEPSLAVAENAFPYAYPEDRDDGDDESVDYSDRAAYDPPWIVPAHVLQPKSRKLHEIIAATAKKARDHPQLEVMLKVKLSARAQFGFLAPTHDFHAYYAYLRDTDPPARPAKARKVAPAPAATLLSAEYSDDDESDDDNGGDDSSACVSAATASAPTPAAATSASTSAAALAPADECDRDATKQATRLKRAKLLAGHFRRAALASSSALHEPEPAALQTDS